MAAATVYLACKRCTVLRSLQEIVEATGPYNTKDTHLKLTSKYYRMLVIDMDDNVQQQHDANSLRVINSTGNACAEGLYHIVVYG